MLEDIADVKNLNKLKKTMKQIHGTSLFSAQNLLGKEGIVSIQVFKLQTKKS